MLIADRCLLLWLLRLLQLQLPRSGTLRVRSVSEEAAATDALATALDIALALAIALDLGLAHASALDPALAKDMCS